MNEKDLAWLRKYFVSTELALRKKQGYTWDAANEQTWVDPKKAEKYAKNILHFVRMASIISHNLILLCEACGKVP